MGNTYAIERELGGGGMSRVFLAVETALDRPIVLKLLPPELASGGRGRVAERLGRRDVALESYQWVANVWRHADPELQPYVTEARGALERLTAERP